MVQATWPNIHRYQALGSDPSISVLVRLCGSVYLLSLRLHRLHHLYHRRHEHDHTQLASCFSPNQGSQPPKCNMDDIQISLKKNFFKHSLPGFERTGTLL